MNPNEDGMCGIRSGSKPHELELTGGAAVEERMHF